MQKYVCLFLIFSLAVPLYGQNEMSLIGDIRRELLTSKDSSIVLRQLLVDLRQELENYKSLALQRGILLDSEKRLLQQREKLLSELISDLRLQTHISTELKAELTMLSEDYKSLRMSYERTIFRQRLAIISEGIIIAGLIYALVRTCAQQ